MSEDVKFLNECADFFERQATSTREDGVFWAYRQNAENLRRIARNLDSAADTIARLDRQQDKLVKCAISHLPAGHPNACNDCDPCISHDRATQLGALMYDWERLYWEVRRLQEEAAGLLMENLALKQNAEDDAINDISSPITAPPRALNDKEEKQT